jgi:hypothetical protein
MLYRPNPYFDFSEKSILQGKQAETESEDLIISHGRFGSFHSVRFRACGSETHSVSEQRSESRNKHGDADRHITQ